MTTKEIKMEKLISMREFTFETLKWIEENNKIEKQKDFTMSIALDRIEAYAVLLSQTLQLGMFVPCDFEGNVLEVYVKTAAEVLADTTNMSRVISKQEVAYHKAQIRVLFEGFEIEGKNCDANVYHFVTKKDVDFYVFCSDSDTDKDKFIKNVDFETIEDLVKYNLTLTETAKKQILV